MTRRKKKSIPPSAKIKQPHKKSTGLVIAIVVTTILAGIPFGLGKYIELNSPGPYDSGAYTYSAKHLLNGAKLGVDEIPSARPGTLIANIIGVKLFGFNDKGPKIVQMMLQLAACVFMFYTLWRVFGSPAAVIGTTVAAIYLSAPVIAKFGNVKEQFMIAFMIYAACSFLLYEYTHKRLWVILSGFFALQPYYFKPTGMSVVFAIILYLFIKNMTSRKWQTLWVELALFLCGYAAGLIIPGSLYLWQANISPLLKSFPFTVSLLGVGVLILAGLPLGLAIIAEKKNISVIKKIPQWVWPVVTAVLILILATTQWNRILAAAGLKGGRYLGGSHSAKSLSELAPQVFRYYKALSVPMLLGLTSLITAVIIWVSKFTKKTLPQDIQAKCVWVLVTWWILDVAFVWISPRSYEQYYLPLCASAAMLSSYAVWVWTQKLVAARNKVPCLVIGMISAIALIIFSVPIFTGFRYSPDRGKKLDYVKAYGYKRRGFAEALNRIKQNKNQQHPWQAVGNYIRTHSDEDETLYVWGWVPGIYVQAQRVAPVPKAFESNMHVIPPKRLEGQIYRMVNLLKEQPPKFIVDSRKIHYPNDRPPLELWPTVRQKMFGNKNPRPLNNTPKEVAAFDAAWSTFLETKIEPKEALRYQAMKPFRDFVMTYYKPVNRREFGTHRLYERIEQTE